MVIGDVVRLREKLKWYEKKPLHGHRVLITRQLTEEYLKLEDLGAELFVFPTIDFLPPEDFTELDIAIKAVENYNFIVFPSPRAVKFFFERFLTIGRDMRDLKGVSICAIGRETAKSLRSYGINADIVPDEYNSEALAKIFKDEIPRLWLGMTEKKARNDRIRILYPRSDIALKGFVEEMQSLGIKVDSPITYRTVKPTEHGKRLVKFLREGRITIATFTSPSSFLNLIDILKDDAKGHPKNSTEFLGTPKDMLKDVAIAAIGKTTARAIEDAGYRVSIMPEKSTIKEMVEAIIKWVKQK